jgi:hypothetical protein
MKHYSFPKIVQYHQTLRHLKLQNSFVGLDENGVPIYDNTIELPIVKFKGTVKLHGSNGAIVFSPDGSFYCQSRENVIDEVKDNAGFAHWVNKEGHKIWEDISKIHVVSLVPVKHIIVFGEWCGGSIQKGVALNELPKMFVVFGLKVIFDVEGDDEDGVKSMWLDSSLIPENPEINIYNVSRVPSYEIEVDLNRPDKAIDLMVEIATKVGDECPFCKTFGVSGIGEGVVWREEGKYSFSNAYKVKDERHQKSKIKKLPTVDVVKMDNIQEAVETHCNEDRMEQIYGKIILSDADKSPQKIGDFIRLLVEDIWVEEGDAIRASDISRKEIGAAVSKKAARWFQEKLKQI